MHHNISMNSCIFQINNDFLSKIRSEVMLNPIVDIQNLGLNSIKLTP